MAVALQATLSGLDAPGDPAWLAKPYRAAWRLTPVAEVLAAVAGAAGVPVQTSPAAHTAIAGARVVVIDAQEGPLRGVLARLEASQGIRFILDAGVLLAVTPDDFAERRTVVRWYNLSAYHLVDANADQPAPALGFEFRRLPNAMNGGEPNSSLFDRGIPGGSTPISDPAAVVDFIQRHTGADGGWEHAGSAIEQRAGDQLMIAATPDLHERVAQLLAGLAAKSTVRSAWRSVSGLLPAGAQVRTGVMPRSEALAVAARITAAQTLVAAGFMGQIIHAAARQERVILDRADVVNGHLDPDTSPLLLGRSLEVKAVRGQELTLLSYRLAWVEDAGPAIASTIRAPAHGGSVASIATAPPTAGHGTAGDRTAPAAPVPAPATVPATAAAAAAENHRDFGEQVTLELPVLWSWRPAGECFLAAGQALVLVSEHPSGQAVMVVVEEP